MGGNNRGRGCDRGRGNGQYLKAQPRMELYKIIQKEIASIKQEKTDLLGLEKVERAQTGRNKVS